MQGYSPKLPLAKDENDGLFAMNKTVLESIKQDLKMLVLTNPGERIMNPEYGIGMRKFLFEQKSDPTYKNIANIVQQQITKYMNFIKVEDIVIETPEDNENEIYIKLVFSIPSLNITDELNLALTSI